MMQNKLLICVLVILTTSGCQSTLSGSDSGPGGGSGRSSAALREVADMLTKNDAQGAAQALLGMDVDRLSGRDRDQYLRLQAQAWLALGEPAKARPLLAQLSKLQQADYLMLAETCSALNDFRCAADGYIQATLIENGAPGSLPADMHERIWSALSQARHGPTMFTHQHHHGWWLLQQELRDAGSVAAQTRAWHRWRSANPDHPAVLEPPAALQRLDQYQPPSISVLLPLSGRLASAGAAVRDGMISALLAEPAAEQTDLRFYDTAAGAPAQIYEAAVADASDVLVGPLLKQEVEAFATLSRFSGKPRLLLNYLPEAGVSEPSGQFQFGIAIEDEVVSLADLVLEHGHAKIGLIHSHANWALRGLAAYRDRWPYPLLTAGFEDAKDITAAVGRAMLVEESEQRKTEITAIIGRPMEFQPRARGDLDAIVALTSASEAQALVPALRYHYADNIPVYTSSQAGHGGERRNLKGFYISEMPLLTGNNPALQAFVDAFQLDQSSVSDLYALGYDAYTLATWLPLLDHSSNTRLPGASGHLYLDRGGRFHRALELSRISNDGQLQAIDP